MISTDSWAGFFRVLKRTLRLSKPCIEVDLTVGTDKCRVTVSIVRHVKVMLYLIAQKRSAIASIRGLRLCKVPQ